MAINDAGSRAAAAAAAARAAAEAARRAAEAAARKAAEAAAKKAAGNTAPRALSAKALAMKAGDSPTSSPVRQALGRDELSRGRGQALRSTSAARLGSTPMSFQGTPDAIERRLEASAKGEVKITPDTVSASVSGGFSGEVKGAKGWGVSFGVNAEAAVVADQKTEDGVTTFHVHGQASVTVSGGVNTPKAGLAVAHSEGITADYSVAMPEAAAQTCDPKTVNPFDPSSMPTGTVVKLDGSQFSSNEFKATFQHLALETKITDSTGVSVAMEKTGTNTVRVTAGPTEAIEAYNAVGVDFGVVSAKLGRTDNLSSATLKTAEFDLSTAEGKAAYNDFLASGTLPSQNGKGISGVATVEKIDYSSQSSAGVSLGPIDLSFQGQKNTGASVVTTYPDGTKDVAVDLDYGSNVPLHLTRKYDAQGNELVSERRYAYTIKADENSAQLMNAALAGDPSKAESGPVHAGQTVTLSFTEDQMRAYMKQTQAASDAGIGTTSLDVLVKDYDDKFINSPEDFAVSLARNLGGTDYEQAERMFTISDGADGQFDGNYSRIDATVTVSWNQRSFEMNFRANRYASPGQRAET